MTVVWWQFQAHHADESLQSTLSSSASIPSSSSSSDPDVLLLEAGCAAATVCRKPRPALGRLSMVDTCAIVHHAVLANLKHMLAHAAKLASV